MRRAVSIGVLGAVLVGLLTFGAGAAPAFACGCGGVVGPPDTAISVSNERAIIHWEDGKETIQMMLDMDSDATRAGMIIPTPFPATVTAGDARTFDLVESTIQPTARVETDWWGLGYLVQRPDEAAASAVSRVQVGPLEATTLLATDSESLETWLTDNDLEISPRVVEALAGYAELGWSITAVTLSNEDGLSGHVDPIRISFESERLVYPMRLAQAETTAQSVRLYVFDKRRTNVSKATSPTIDLDAEVTVAWSGEPEDRRLRALGEYLTVFDVRYDDPPKQATGDIGVIYSLSERDVQPETVHYRMITLLGVPVGTLIVLWTTLGLVLTLGHFVGRRRAR